MNNNRNVSWFTMYTAKRRGDASEAVAKSVSVNEINGTAILFKKIILSLALLLTHNALGHEFWIEALDYTLDNNQPLRAKVKSGEHFKGTTYPFMPDRIVNAELKNDTGRYKIVGNAGSRPAIRVDTGDAGLHIVSYQSTPSSLVHNSFDDFLVFLEEDGLRWVEQAHLERNLPANGFVEQFTRYAKALVSVGDGNGSDQPTGLPYELIALDNPYTTKKSSITIQLLERGKPVVGSQVTVFQKDNDDTSDDQPLLLRTDESGKVLVPRGNGGVFLISSVIMTVGGHLAPWHSHWASITYSTDESLD